MADYPIPPGFDGENFQVDDPEAAPAWAKEHLSFKGSEKVLSMPRDINAQPYSSVDARKGDWVYSNQDKTKFFVLVMPVNPEELTPPPPAAAELPGQPPEETEETPDEPTTSGSKRRRSY